jgi:hypothetical protein
MSKDHKENLNLLFYDFNHVAANEVHEGEQQETPN